MKGGAQQMVQFRIWPTAAIALLATTAIALAGPTPNDIGTVRPVSPVTRPVTLVRHPVAVATRPVVRRANQRVNPDVSDDVLLARINRIDHEDCAMVMRDRADFDQAILAGILEQRQAECARARFARRPHFAAGQFRDADDRRFNDGHRFFAANGQTVAPRFADVRDDRLISRLRRDDRRDDQRFSPPRQTDRRDDRVIRRLRTDDRRDDRHMGAARFASAHRFQTGRVAAVNRGSRPMRRPRP